MKLKKNVICLDIHKYFFSQQVLDYWYALPLPQTAIDAKSINQFKLCGVGLELHHCHYPGMSKRRLKGGFTG